MISAARGTLMFLRCYRRCLFRFSELHLLGVIQSDGLVTFLDFHHRAVGARFAHLAEELFDGICVFAVEISAMPRGGAIYWFVG